MSTDATPPASAPEKVAYTEKEMKLLVAALLSLKSGVPDIDYTRFQKNGNFNTMKTAQNTWGNLKKKIKEVNPEALEAAEAAKGDAIPKPKSTPKKRAKKESDSEDTVASPEASAKKVRTPRKKAEAAAAAAAADDDDDGDNDAAEDKTPVRKSPTKKKKTTKTGGKATQDDEDEGAEAETAEDVKMEGTADVEDDAGVEV